jgi:glutathione synthase
VVERKWYDVQRSADLDVASSVDLVQLRIDPPVDARYLHTTYLLDLVEAAGTTVANRPAGIRAFHEKLSVLRFPDLCPQTLLTTDVALLRDFVARVGLAVLKPVDGFAGDHVWLVRDDRAATALLESATGRGRRRQIIAQEYLPAVERGNKRLFLLHGRILGAVMRRPSADDFRIGPPFAAADIVPADRRIVGADGRTLLQHWIALAGLDVIDDRLIEVNVTCPGGMAKSDALLGTDLSGTLMRELLWQRAPELPEEVPA